MITTLVDIPSLSPTLNIKPGRTARGFEAQILIAELDQPTVDEILKSFEAAGFAVPRFTWDDIDSAVAAREAELSDFHDKRADERYDDGYSAGYAAARKELSE